MEKQYSKAYNPIGQSGCYFLSLGAIAEEATGEFLRPNTVNEVYAHSVSSGVMEPNCYISNPERVLLYFIESLGSRADPTYIGWWNSDSEVEFWNKWNSSDITYEILRYKTKWGYHFTTANYDPYPELSRESEVTGRRYFNIKD